MLGLLGAAPALAAQPYPLNFKTFALNAADSSSTRHTFSSGGCAHGSLRGRRSTRRTPTRSPNYSGDGVDGSGPYVSGTWTSGVTNLSFAFNELVASWNATTPAGSWIQVEVQPQIDDGHWAKWYILGRWSSERLDLPPHLGRRSGRRGRLRLDRHLLREGPPGDRVPPAGDALPAAAHGASPTLSRLSAIALEPDEPEERLPEPTTMTGTAVDLGVPQYSQEIHHGEYPQYDNGGEAWCSPTSTSMVVAYWSQKTGHELQPDPGRVLVGDGGAAVAAAPGSVGRLHRPRGLRLPLQRRRQLAVQRRVRRLARPGRRRDRSCTTCARRSRSSRPASRSSPRSRGSRTSSTAAIKSTNGHLLVIEGFTADGTKVIVNDPASTDDSAVKHFYDREQFERAWIPASGGIVYVIRPVGWTTPSLTANNS